MSNEIEIRELKANEIGLARSLIVMFGADDESDESFSPPGDEYIAGMLARNDFYVLVALDGERLVGGLTAYEMMMFKREEPEMFLYEIEVAETHQRRGIGTALIGLLKQICVRRGITQIFVGTEHDNTAARTLYALTGGALDADSVWFNYSLD